MKLYLLSGFTIWFLVSIAQPSSFQSRGIGGGGALFCPSINPANQNEIYVGCDMTELFHTTDMGAHWNPLHFKKIQGGHDSYVSFTGDPDIRYAADYSTINNVDMIRPVKSTDGGQTWNVLTGNPYSTQPDLLRVIGFSNPNYVMLADYGTIYFSNTGGNSFTQIHTAISNGSGNHIAGVYYNGSVIYIATNDGIICSTNGGNSFFDMATSGIPSGEYILSFAGAKEGNTMRFVCITSTSVWAGYQFGSDYWGAMSGVYMMDNESRVWSPKMGGIAVGTDFPVFAGMAENDIDTMYLAGGNSSSSPIVMRSIGSGNWSHVFLTSNNQNIYTGWAGQNGDKQWSFPEAPFGFQVCPGNSDMAIITTYSDIHITTDGGATWHQKYLDAADENPANAQTPKQKKYHGIGLENTTNWQVMWLDSNNIMSAFSDICGVMSDDKGASWKFIPSLNSNSTYRIVKHANGKIYACTSNIHDLYQTTRIYDSHINSGNGAIWMSDNNGASFTSIHAFGNNNGVPVWIALDPTNSNRMYAAVAHSDTAKGGIWKTNNLSAGAGSTWTRCKIPPRTEGHAFNINVLNNGDLVVSFSARKPTSGSSFTQSSGVFYSTNQGTSWSDRTDNGMKYYTKDVVIDPNDSTGSTWYACAFFAWGNASGNAPGLYKTTNKGLNWQLILPDLHVNSCTFNPSNPDELYVTTEADGLWLSTDINSATPTFSLVDAYDFRHPVRVFFNPYKPTEMWVSAFGNGMKVGNIGDNDVTISGGIFTESGDPVPSVTVNLTGDATDNFVTGIDGLYSFTVPAGGSYTIAPSKNDDITANNGISTLDIILIQKQILSVDSLDTPCKIIAADVNGSQSVSTLDIVLMRTVILGNVSSFPNGRLWEFVKSDFVFDNLHVFSFEKSRTYSGISQSQINQDFIGIKLGDVNESWDNGIP